MANTALDEKDNHICGFCKYMDNFFSVCNFDNKWSWIYEEDTCDNWEGDDNETS